MEKTRPKWPSDYIHGFGRFPSKFATNYFMSPSSPATTDVGCLNRSGRNTLFPHQTRCTRCTLFACSRNSRVAQIAQREISSQMIVTVISTEPRWRIQLSSYNSDAFACQLQVRQRLFLRRYLDICACRRCEYRPPSVAQSLQTVKSARRNRALRSPQLPQQCSSTVARYDCR